MRGNWRRCKRDGYQVDPPSPGPVFLDRRTREVILEPWRHGRYRAAAASEPTRSLPTTTGIPENCEQGCRGSYEKLENS